MNKQAISVTLDPSNLVWLRAQTIVAGCRSVSEVLDRLVHEARTGGQERPRAVSSVVGTVEIAEMDPDLSTADAAVRAFFSSSASRHQAEVKKRAHSRKATSFSTPRKKPRA